MKKLFALLFSFALVFAFPTVSFAKGADKDCKDFATWEEAQKYFESKGGSSKNNVDRLDNDHDGLVCENMKGFDPNHKNPNDGGNTGNNDDNNSGNTGSGDDNGSNNNGSNDNNNTGNSDNNNSNNGSNNTNNGGKMPKTATSHPTGLLAGVVLLLVGAGMFAVKPLFGKK